MARWGIVVLFVILSGALGCATTQQPAATQQGQVDLAQLLRAGAKRIHALMAEEATRTRPTPKELGQPRGERIDTLIEQGKVLPGMTKEQVLLAKGKPEAVNVIEGGWGTIEQWVYGGYNPEFIYITNGRVTAH